VALPSGPWFLEVFVVFAALLGKVSETEKSKGALGLATMAAFNHRNPNKFVVLISPQVWTLSRLGDIVTGNRKKCCYHTTHERGIRGEAQEGVY
jgi:hypothetical protein